MADLQLNSSAEGGVQIVAIVGRLDSGSIGAFDEKLAAIDGGRVVLDIAKLDYISSAGLRSVLAAQKRIHAAGGRFALAAPTPAVAEVLEISGFVTLVAVHPGREAAVAALG